MFASLLKGVNCTRVMIAMVVVFAVIWATDFAIHGFIMVPMYASTPHLWRSDAEMGTYFPLILLSQLILAKGFTVVFAKGYEGGGAMEGVRYALYVWPLVLAPTVMQYAVTPLTAEIFWYWVGFGFLQTLLCGITVSLVYKR